jgi:hypothetical protein
MAFHDRPLIDPPSVNSELSENAVKRVLNQLTGFVCRPDIPDKGCDFDVELILIGQNASNRRFGIQIKSVEILPLLADGKTISYAFSTSRLGYLLNRLVGIGLLVIYDVANDQLYYEYADRLYWNLMDEKGSDEWQKQDSVNIHIPISNKLDKEAALNIHQTFVQRFEKASFILASQGSRYDLPVIKTTTDERIDIRNPDQVKEFLLKHGLGLMRSYDMDLAYALISQLPAGEIENHIELMIMASVVYGEVGKRYESENYIRKLQKRKAIIPEYDYLIGYSHLKNRLALDQITIAEFIDEAKGIRHKVHGLQNEILLDLNIIFYELLAIKFYHGIPEDMHDRIKKTFERIQILETDEANRHLLEVCNSENLSAFIGYYRLKQLNDVAIQRAVKVPNRSQELVQESKMIIALQEELNQGLERLFEIGKETGDKLLQGYTILVRSRYIVTQEIDLISQQPILADIRFHDEPLFLNHITLCLAGVDLFRDVSYFENAYQCLCCGLEMIMMARKHYHYKDNFDLEQLLVLKEQIEQQLEIDTYEIQLPLLIQRLEKYDENRRGRPMIDLKDLDDVQLNTLAQTFGRALSIPPAFMPNVVQEFKCYRSFYTRCNDDYEIIRNGRNNDPLVVYRQPVQFVIKNKITGIQSVLTETVDDVLNDWGL